MLSLTGIEKRFGGRVLFEDAALQVVRGERIGLTGPNGAGKTTLFGMILGKEEPDNGQISIEKNVSVGYLPQESAPVGDETIIELALSIHPEMTTIRRRLAALDAGEVHSGWDDGQLYGRFEELGGYGLEARAKQLLAGLGFKTSDFERPARELSGGWVMRAHLARLLVQQPDLLMLDEPTNHLDLEALIWFQEYLKNYPGAILVISHDREFLNELVGAIVEIRQKKLARFSGNYESYLAQRELADEQWRAAYVAQQADISRLKAFADRFGAKASKAAQAQSKLREIARMDKIEPPPDDRVKLKFNFPQPVKGGRIAITLKDIHQSYGDKKIYEGMNFVAERGQRIVLVGPNGAGKSTLLKLLAGVLEFQAGERELGYNTKAGYFAQYRLDTLNANNNCLEEAMATLRQAGKVLSEQFARTLLGAFLFRGDDVFKKVSVLSGGEKSRLGLVKLLLDPPNLLLMDEPTTHLDIPSIEALITALRQFEGTLIFISHDVFFIKKMADRVLHVDAGKLTMYEGDYQYFLDRNRTLSARAALTATTETMAGEAVADGEDGGRSGAGRKEDRRAAAENRQGKSREKNKWQGIVSRLEAEIEKLESRQRELIVEMETPATYGVPGRALQINEEIADVLKKLGRITGEWESAATKLAAIA